MKKMKEEESEELVEDKDERKGQKNKEITRDDMNPSI